MHTCTSLQSIRSSFRVSDLRVEASSFSDLHEILEVETAAFTLFQYETPWWSDAPSLVPLLTAHPRFEWRFSRIVRHVPSGRILAHALWMPYEMRLAGTRIPAVNLAPLAVHSMFQNLGLGGMLMDDGITLFRSLGFRILLIVGHPWYYPRFGLRTGCYGRKGIVVLVPAPLSELPTGYEWRPVLSGDEEELLPMWESLRGSEDGALSMEEGLFPWLSRTVGIVTGVLLRSGRIVGYARTDTRKSAKPDSAVLMLLSRDREAASVLLGKLSALGNWTPEPGAGLFLPAGRETEVCAALFPEAVAKEETAEPFMAMALNDCELGNGSLSDILESIRKGERPPLAVDFPVYFDC